MTAPEYIQLKAYARQDGFFLALFWIVCFISYIIGLTNQLVGMLSMLMVVASPFFVFYGAVLLAVAQYLYFAYMDNGYLVNSLARMMSTDEAKMMLEQYGAQTLVDEGLAEMAATRPIDYALNILTINISLGFILGVPIGLIMQRRKLD